jgi:Fe2+ transport system protein B
MENQMENIEKKLTPQEELEDLRIKHLAALDDIDQTQAKQIEEEMNELQQELGIEQTREAA